MKDWNFPIYSPVEDINWGSYNGHGGHQRTTAVVYTKQFLLRGSWLEVVTTAATPIQQQLTYTQQNTADVCPELHKTFKICACFNTVKREHIAKINFHWLAHPKVFAHLIFTIQWPEINHITHEKHLGRLSGANLGKNLHSGRLIWGENSNQWKVVATWNVHIM